MQSMTEFFKAGSQSKTNTILLRVFILSTLLLVVATWNIQHSSKRMFSPQVLLPSEHVLIFEGGNNQSVTTTDPGIVELAVYEPNIDPQGKDNKAANISRIPSSISRIDSPVFPLDTVAYEETKNNTNDKPEPGKNKGVANELIGVVAAIAVVVALVITGTPVIIALGLAIPFWGVARQSIEAMF